MFTQACKALALAGIKSLKDLRTAQPHVIEAACQRKPTFGNMILKSVRMLPDLFGSLKGVKENTKEEGINVVFEVEVGLRNMEINTSTRKGRSRTTASILLMTNDNVGANSSFLALS